MSSGTAKALLGVALAGAGVAAAAFGIGSARIAGKAAAKSSAPSTSALDSKLPVTETSNELTDDIDSVDCESGSPLLCSRF